MIRIVLALGVVALLGACTRPALDSYDTSCASADDCAFVSTVDGCDCRCGDFAINVDEVERFNREQAPFCPIPSTVDCLCPGNALACVDAACAIEQP